MDGGIVNFDSCNIYSNTAPDVRLPLLESPWTPWSYHIRKVSDCGSFASRWTGRKRLPPLETPWTPWSYHMRKVSDC